MNRTTREQFESQRQSQQEYDDNIRAESNDIIHTLQEKLSACEESLATALADRDALKAELKVAQRIANTSEEDLTIDDWEKIGEYRSPRNGGEADV